MATRSVYLVVFAVVVATSSAQQSLFGYERRSNTPSGGLLTAMSDPRFRTRNFQMANVQAVNEVRPYEMPLASLRTTAATPIVDSIYVQPPVPDCPLEVHPDTETMFIMRGPLGDPEPRTCPPGTYFLRSACSCVNTPLDKCELRPSAIPGWYEENVFGVWIRRPCGPGSAFNPSTCDCSYAL